MIRHIVLFKFKPETPEPERAGLHEMLLGLPGKIEWLLEGKAGRDVLRSPRSYDLAFVSLFAGLDELSKYAAHPDHLPVIQKAKEICDNVVVVDFEE